MGLTISLRLYFFGFFHLFLGCVSVCPSFFFLLKQCSMSVDEICRNRVWNMSKSCMKYVEIMYEVCRNHVWSNISKSSFPQRNPVFSLTSLTLPHHSPNILRSQSLYKCAPSLFKQKSLYKNLSGNQIWICYVYRLTNININMKFP